VPAMLAVVRWVNRDRPRYEAAAGLT